MRAEFVCGKMRSVVDLSVVDFIALFVDVKPLVAVPVMIFSAGIFDRPAFSLVSNFGSAVFKRVAECILRFDQNNAVGRSITDFPVVIVDDADGAFADVIVAVVVLIV